MLLSTTRNRSGVLGTLLMREPPCCGTSDNVAVTRSDLRAHTDLELRTTVYI
jgi:hypothetical protein